MNKNIQQVIKGGFQHVWHAKTIETYHESGKVTEEIEMCHCALQYNHTTRIYAWQIPEKKLRRTRK